MTTNPFDALIERARSDPRHIVLAEGEDERVIEGAARVVAEGIASITLLGREGVIRERAADYGLSALPFAILDPAASDKLEEYARHIHALRREKGVSLDEEIGRAHV